MDVTDVQAVRAALAPLPSFDILVNSAGTNRPAAFTDVRQADFDDVIALNLRATFFVSQFVARGMIRDKKPGSIIHVSSQMGHVGSENRTVYCASKFAVEGLCKSMSIELAPHAIRVNTLCPTFIETPLTKAFFSDAEFKDKVLKQIKLGRLGRAEEVMGAALFLASDASSLMTGASLVIDGGWTAS